MVLDLLKRGESDAPLTAEQHDTNFDAIMSEVNAKLNASAVGSMAAKNNVATADIVDAAVTLVKLANLTAAKFIGRTPGAGTGVPQALDITAFGLAFIQLADAAAARANLVVDSALGQRTVTDNTTLVLTDVGLIVLANKATAMTVTVPPNSSVAFPTNTVVHVYQLGAGATTIVAGAGVTLEKPSDLTLAIRNQSSMVSLWKRATNTWAVLGALGTA